MSRFHEDGIMASELPVVVRRYFEAWETHDINEVSDMFAPNALYEIVGAKVISGLEAIKTYWAYNAARQRCVTWAVVDSFTCQNHTFISWTATFERIDEDQIYFLSGLMWLTEVNGKIARLTESYHKRTQPAP